MEKKFQQAIREKDQLQKQIDVIISLLIFCTTKLLILVLSIELKIIQIFLAK